MFFFVVVFCFRLKLFWTPSQRTIWICVIVGRTKYFFFFVFFLFWSSFFKKKYNNNNYKIFLGGPNEMPFQGRAVVCKQKVIHDLFIFKMIKMGDYCFACFYIHK